MLARKSWSGVHRGLRPTSVPEQSIPGALVVGRKPNGQRIGSCACPRTADRVEAAKKKSPHDTGAGSQNPACPLARIEKASAFPIRPLGSAAGTGSGVLTEPSGGIVRVRRNESNACKRGVAFLGENDNSHQAFARLINNHNMSWESRKSWFRQERATTPNGVEG